MTDFATFARAHGLRIRDLIPDGKVRRCPTDTKPRKRNGAYAWDGRKGFVQDWTIHPEAIPFRGEAAPQTRVEPPRNVGKAREAARVLAREIIARSAFQTHPYLVAKGFPKAQGLVDPTDGRLIVPMYNARRYGEVLSVQRIGADGTKLFLKDGTAKDAVFHLGRGPTDVLVEGYATGLSVKAALDAMYRKARVVVCFSAGNLASVAAHYSGFVVADNDASKAGEEAARKAGLPWVMPDEVGMDANDLHQRDGLEAVRALLGRDQQHGT